MSESVHFSPTDLTRPVFVIGAGRSGTTVFFELLSKHPDLGFFTNHDDVLCGTPLFGFSRVIADNKYWSLLGRRKNWKNVNDFNSWLPRKTEAYRFWTRFSGLAFTKGYLWGVKADEASARKITGKVRRLLRFQGRKLFAAKLTGPGRVEYLRSIFPNARFIHLVRDPFAQIHSTTRVGFWNAGGAVLLYGGIMGSL